MDVRDVLSRFAFNLYSALSSEFSENSVYSPYSAFIAAVISASISPDEESCSDFLDYLNIPEEIDVDSLLPLIKTIINEHETRPMHVQEFVKMLNHITSNENSENLSFEFMKKHEQCLFMSKIKTIVLSTFPEFDISVNDENFYSNFIEFFDNNKEDERMKNFLDSINIPISVLRKAPLFVCPQIVFLDQSYTEDDDDEIKGLILNLQEACYQFDIKMNQAAFPQPVVDSINQMMDLETDSKVTHIISEDMIEEEVPIVNAHYSWFEAKWEQEFADVQSLDFHLKNGQKRKVKMMLMRNHNCPYYENDTLQVLQLNYACSDYSMIYILNKNPESVQINYGQLTTAIDSLVETDVYIEIPRFEAEFGPTLIDASFPSKIFEHSYMAIIQKAHIGNYEEGTSPTPSNPREDSSQENASINVSQTGITRLDFNLLGGKKKEAQTCQEVERSGAASEFLCNHPFLFFLINRKTKLIIFMGTITDPISVDLKPLTQTQLEENFLAEVRGETPPFEAEVIKEDNGDDFWNLDKGDDQNLENDKDGSLWNDIEKIGQSNKQTRETTKPSSPRTIEEEEIMNESKPITEQQTPLNEKWDVDLYEFIYGSNENDYKPKVRRKKDENLFGKESKDLFTYPSFSPWSKVVFQKQRPSSTKYEVLTKSKYPKMNPLLHLSSLTSTLGSKDSKLFGAPKIITPKSNSAFNMRGIPK